MFFNGKRLTNLRSAPVSLTPALSLRERGLRGRALASKVQQSRRGSSLEAATARIHVVSLRDRLLTVLRVSTLCDLPPPFESLRERRREPQGTTARTSGYDGRNSGYGDESLRARRRETREATTRTSGYDGRNSGHDDENLRVRRREPQEGTAGASGNDSENLSMASSLPLGSLRTRTPFRGRHPGFRSLHRSLPCSS